jgi:endonuclease/exonuclease/phosphatase family metal-dependent hydrolase
MHSEVIRLATFNVRCGPSEDGPNHWDARKGIFLDALGEMGPHILAVQECYPFQGDEIGMRFPNWGRLGVGRYHGVDAPARQEESRSGEHTAIFFDAVRYQVDSCGAFWHSDTPDQPASMSWGNDLPRVTTWAVLRSRPSGRAFILFNTHFHWGEPYCAKTTDLHLARITRHAGDLPCILTGDFNLSPDSETHGRFTAAAPRGLGLRDAWPLLGRSEEGAGTTHSFTGKPENRIDWILVSPAFSPISIEKIGFQRQGRFPSDHFPVLAELELRGTEGR